jgi:fibronectin type 3 domain-containing protein
VKRDLGLFLTFSILFVITFSPIGCAEKGCSRGDPGTINLAWNPNKEPDLAGYRVYYGTASRKYGPGIDVGNVTSYSLTGLTKGQKYYISITAYDKSGKESPFSGEVSGFPK